MKTKTTILAIVLMIIVTIFTSVGQVFIKQGVNLISNAISIFNLSLIFGMFLYGIGMIIMLIALKQGEASVLTPILALGYIWVVFLAFLIFGESINNYKIMGILIIFFGVSLIGIGGKR